MSNEAFRREEEAFQSFKRQLLADERYRGKYIAVVNQRIVAVGDDDRELSKIIDERYGNIPALIGRIVEKERVVEMPSPEVARNVKTWPCGCRTYVIGGTFYVEPCSRSCRVYQISIEVGHRAVV